MTDTLGKAARMIYAAICAYQIHEKGWKPDKNDPKPDRTISGPDGTYFYNVVDKFQDKVGFLETGENGYVPDFVASGDDKINAGFVGVLKNGQMVVSIRGTIPPSLENDDLIEWIKDWAQDADMPPIAWPYLPVPGGGTAHVEEGFGKATNDLFAHLAPKIQAAITQHNPTGIIVTGHSKGAAMTFLMASIIANNFKEYADKIEVFAFAAPVTGDDAFKAAYAAAGLDATTHRYQVGYDMVPFVPLWKAANIFEAVDFDPPVTKGCWKRLKDRFGEDAWKALERLVTSKTKGGYDAVGDFTYFGPDHKLTSGTVQETALPIVASALDAFKVGEIAGAHSATDSYAASLEPYWTKPD